MKLKFLAAGLIVAALGVATISPAQATSTVNQATCKPAKKGVATCFAIRHALILPKTVKQKPQNFASTLNAVAYGANALRKAYDIRVLGSRSKVIAIVDATHSQTAYDDLVGYREMYGLPGIDRCGKPGATQGALPAGSNPCFVQVDQDSRVVSKTDQTEDSGWAQEIALDLAMASAACPNCSILLVEAKSATFGNLNTAVATAADFIGVRSISNSYGGSDSAPGSMTAYTNAAKRGIAVTASTGDSGYGVSAPASFEGVISVGGTSLFVDAKGNWLNETAWISGGSGCSKFNDQPKWQQTSDTKCSGKATADVAAVADPATGVAVYYDGGWYSFGGTSASSPFIAGLYAAKANFGDDPAGYTVAHNDSLHDVTSGSNGKCKPAIWCTATEGWDAPTGWGSPSGANAF